MLSQTLPKSSSVDISALSRLFKQRTNSYKYLFFFSLLNKVHTEKLAKIKLHQLADDMLAHAWYPHVFFKLSFGVQDQVATVLDQLDFSLSGRSAGSVSTEKLLRKAITKQGDDIGSNELLRYVPYRLLTVFFETELRRKRDHTKNSLIDLLATDLFDEKKPFYRLYETDEQTYLEFHPCWQAYFVENYTIVYGWLCWEWLKYLQARNPSVPAIQNKLFSPANRSSLSAQKKYWREIISKHDIKCIFSGETLCENDFVLDHYLPWSFVCHDRLWNLIPVKVSANSAKKNHIPDQKYLEKFIELQMSGLKLSKGILSEGKWGEMTESFIVDLKPEDHDLLDLKKVTKAYHQVIQPLMVLAGNSGFQTNWCYQ